MMRPRKSLCFALSALLVASVWNTQALRAYADELGGAAGAVASAMAQQQAATPTNQPVTPDQTVPAQDNAAPTTDEPASTPEEQPLTDDKSAAPESPTTPVTPVTPAPETPVAATLAPADASVNTWSGLQSAIDDATSGDTITLTGDITATDDDDEIDIDDKSIKLDLAGYTLDRGLTDSEDEDGHVLEVFGDDGVLTIVDSAGTGLITGGYADNGGGIYVHEGASLVLEGGTIKGNRAESDGGGVSSLGRFTATGGTITENAAGDNGGGVYADEDSSLELTGTTISNNTSKNEGGGVGIYITDSTAKLESCNVTGNIAKDDDGGGIYQDSDSLVLNLVSTTVSDNEARGGRDGGGIYLNGGECNITNGAISGNKAARGGGIYCDDTNVTVNAATISSNEANGTEGGGVYTDSDSTLELTECTLTQNTATTDGGALSTHTDAKLDHCTLNANHAIKSGGAVRVRANEVTISGGSVNNNRADECGGGFYITSSGSVKLVSSASVTENVGLKGGGGFFVSDSAYDVKVGNGVVVTGNQANNIYLASSHNLEVVETLGSDTSIGVALERISGTFTTGFSNYNPDDDPSQFFVPEAGYSVMKDGDGEARVVASDWVELQRIIDETGNGGTVSLTRDWQAVNENTALRIPAGKTITLDLYGHKIDRKRSDYADDGEVFIVDGELSITDSSYAKEGTITGGYGPAGGFRINGGGKVKLQAGTITGNHAKEGGGGVWVHEGGTLETYGGLITKNSSDDNGGGVYNSGTFVNSSCDITENTAKGDGGGVFNLASMTLDSGSISKNSAEANGGGVFHFGSSFEVMGGEIKNNKAKKDGGGACVKAATMTFNSGEITSNKAGGNGGGICLYTDSTLNLNGGTITSNNASYDGGGIYNDKGTLNVKGGPDVSNNAGTIGRNILLTSDSRVTIVDALSTTDPHVAHIDMVTKDATQPLTSGYTSHNCSLDSFSTNDSGNDKLIVREGELWMRSPSANYEVSAWDALQDAVDDADDGDVIVLTSDVVADDDDEMIDIDDKTVVIDLNGFTLDRNLDDSDGADGHVIELFGDAKLYLNDSVGTGLVTGGYANNGGGIYVHSDAHLVINGGTIMDNRAEEDGGGVYVYGKVTSYGGAIVRNKADDNGGGIYCSEDGRMNLESTVIANNTAGNEGGGLDLRMNDEEASLNKCVVRDNEAEDDDGGGFNMDRGSLKLTLTDTDVIGNESNGGHSGGAVYQCNGTLTVVRGTFSDNSAETGGAILCDDDCKLTCNGTRFEDNEAEDGDGGAICNYSPLSLTDCTFKDNTAKKGAGAVAHSDDEHATFTNCLFDGNRAKEGSGGAIYVDGEDAKIDDCTFTSNEAQVNGGAVMVNNDTTITRGTFAQNVAKEYGGAIHVHEDGELLLDGTDGMLTVTQNSALLGGGGIYVDETCEGIGMKGAVKVLGNEDDSDFYLEDDARIKIKDDLAGSQVRVLLEKGTGTFTKDYRDKSPATSTADIFMAQEGFAVIDTSDGEAEVIGSDWTMLQRMIDESPSGAIITLERSWRAAPENVALVIPEGKTITLDLNGFTIDRARTKHSDDGQVFTVEGNLIVRDTSEGAAGTICGGNGDAGGLLVKSGASLELQSGSIMNNFGKNGAGVFVSENASFTMSGGQIVSNGASSNGGGICCDDHSTVTLTGGLISNNEADKNGGAIWYGPDAHLSVGGSPKVIDNYSPRGTNILIGKNPIYIDSQLGTDAILDVVTQNTGTNITHGLTTSGSPATAFTYEGATDRLETRDGELYLKVAQADVFVSSWQQLQEAINDEANRDKVIALAANITADEDDDRLHLVGKSVIVDLAGYRLDRDLDDDDEDGHVFELSDNSSLTIRDSAGTGVITGGYAEHGGAINIHEGSTCTIESGTISGNRASHQGGAIMVYGTLCMSGGFISDNKSDDGGAIYVHEHGTIILKDVTISHNEAEEYGGGGINNKGSATLTDCVLRCNKSDDEGGAIYNGPRELTLVGCTIVNNESSNGGALNTFGNVTITDTTIEANTANDRGGAIYVHGSLTMIGGSVSSNVGDDGGGIYNGGGLLTLAGVELNGNTSGKGGGALNNKGTGTLTDCTLSNNSSAKGGAIYANEDAATTVTNCAISNNSSSGTGGGISAYGELTVEGGSIDNNRAEDEGGGICAYGKAVVRGTTITSNSSEDWGGGIALLDHSCELDGVNVSNNNAVKGGSGVYVDEDADDCYVTGATKVRENESGDVYLSSDKVLTVKGSLNGEGADRANIGITCEEGLGTVFTDGYSDTNPGVEPSDFFFSNDDYEVFLDDGEASTKVEDPDPNPFIDPGSQVNADPTTLNGRNWMSGISGARRLNEINIPGTHDSGTKVLEGNVSTGLISTYAGLIGAGIGIVIGTLTLAPGLGLLLGVGLGLDLPNLLSDMFLDFAHCQTRFIDEQLEDGIRRLDIRLNTYYSEQGYPVNKKNNGHDLYVLHGKDEKAGSYFAKDHDDEFLTFKTVLDWVKDFLAKHPTETIVMGVQIDSVDDVYDEGMSRIKKHLHDELATQINPSTGKPYLYMQDGVFDRPLTGYPELKDCRGQIVLLADEADTKIIGGLAQGVGLDHVDRPDGSYKDNAATKIKNLTKFFADHGYDNLPSSGTEHLDYYYSVGLNGTDTRIPPKDTPLDIAEEVLDACFGENGLLLNREGKFLGLISMDGARASTNEIVWRTNFFSGLEYCKVTVKSGLSEEDTKTYDVMYGTKIDIPECIFANPSAEGTYFQTWEGSIDHSPTGTTWESSPGNTFIITADTTFTAKWGDQITPVGVLWRDGEDKDGLRPLTLTLRVGDQTYTAEASENWRLSLPGDVAPDDVTVDWDGIGPEDTGDKYTCSVHRREGGSGISIELTHTPDNVTTASGTIQWVDNNDAEGKRPENVTVHLLASGRLIDSTIATAEGGWAWDFGERPAFVDGEEIYYTVSEDPLDDYTTTITGMNITNVLREIGETCELGGLVVWADDNNAAGERPDHVTLNLLRNGEQYQTKQVRDDGKGNWLVDFEIDGAMTEADYSVTQDEVAGYNTKVYLLAETSGVLVVVNTIETHEHKPIESSRVSKAATCEEDGVKTVVTSCEECGEILSSTDEVIPATGHDWGQWVVTKEATSTQPGEETRTCKNDPNHTQRRTIPVVGHVHELTFVEGRDATCTEDGVVPHYRCTGGDHPCGLCFLDEGATQWVHDEGTVAHALGHDWGEWQTTTPATERTEGVETRVCSRNHEHTEERPIARLNHEHGLVHVDAVPATCLQDGNIEYWRCVEGDDPCGLIFTDAEGTQWVHEEAVRIPATGHDWGEWRMIAAPTETEPGQEMRTCRNLSVHFQLRTIPPVEHSHVLTYVEAKEPTCTEPGNIAHYQCTGGENPCGNRYADRGATAWLSDEDVRIPPLGHSWGEPTYAWAPDSSSCTASHTCVRCPEVESETVNSTSRVVSQPAVGIRGMTMYTAVFQNLSFKPQSRVVDDIPALTGLAYSPNGAMTGVVPSQPADPGERVKVAANAFVRTGYDFVGWNTKADGSGTTYQPGDFYVVGESGDWLYAQWKPKAPQGSQVMYRLYNPNSGEHFYTANAHERDAVAQAGWKYEGIGWTAPISGSPVYRLYNPNVGDHHYTVSAGERDALVAAGWSFEGVGWCSALPSGKPIYREYNPNAWAGAHNFTPSVNEHIALVHLGWLGEGIAWYGV